MALLQITEPGNKTAPHQHKLAIGIDLGTTNSLVASVISGRNTILKTLDGEKLIPSIVHIGSEIIVGSNAKNFAITDPKHTIFSNKRFIGLDKNDINSTNYPYDFTNDNDINIKTVQGTFSATQISSILLKEIKNIASLNLGDEVSDCVITVPAYFNDSQRTATKHAATLAGLNVLRLISEPTAAALAYGLDKGKSGIFAVYDLGGGTFDVSILNFQKGVFEVLATSGNSRLGGDDFDDLIIQDVISQLQLTRITPKQKQQLKKYTQLAKQQLSTSQEAKFEFEGKYYSITQDNFKQLSQELIKQTLRITKKAVRDSAIEIDDLQGIILVGGSTRMPIVTEALQSTFQCEILNDINPDEVVALGAGIQANVLAGNSKGDDIVLLDVLPLSLGIETMGSLVEKIIHRNTTIPITRAQEFTTFKDGQTVMSLHIVQGERETVEHCRSLAKFNLSGIPPMIAGNARILVEFSVDSDGLLSVSASEKTTGVSANIEVKPSFGLSDKKMKQMLTDSILFAEEDIKLRQLNEAKVEAKRVLEAINSALAKDSNMLNGEMLDSITLAIDELKNVATINDENIIKKKIKHLEEISEKFVAMRMNSAVQKMMKNHNINEFK